MMGARLVDVGLAILVATVVAGGTACQSRTPDEVETFTPVSVTTSVAAKGTVRGVVHAAGIVTPAPGAELLVVAPEAARITELPHAAGDIVRRGDVLVRFEMPAAAADVQKQHAEVNRANAALETARAAQTRARELFDRGVAARREVEDADRALADAQAAVAQAMASRVAAETVASRATVRATFDGMIAKRFHNAGDWVEPSASDPVLRFVDPERLEVLAAIPLADASRVHVGAAGRLLGGSSEPSSVKLQVRSRPTAVEAGTGTVPVRLGFVARTSIPVGAPVQVSIDAEQHQDVVVVPGNALVRDGEETAVFVASGGKAHRRLVRIGIADDTSVEILSGISAGDRVIVAGQAGLPDDAAIAEGPANKATPRETAGEKDDTK
jgi:RND family efflux transporter MFP subunit